MHEGTDTKPNLASPVQTGRKKPTLVPSAQGDLTINFSTSFAVHSRSYIALGHVSCIISF